MMVRVLMSAARVLAFGRHIPVRKLVRRVELDVRRRLRDRLASKARFTAPSPLPRLDPPVALLPPRGGLSVGPRGELAFHLLGRELILPGRSIDWTRPGVGAAHQLLRMNLHYMEYLESVDDALFEDIIEQWIDANPAHAPGSWRDGWNAYALSLRVVVWMQQLAARAARLNGGLLAKARASLVEQMRFLERNLETDIGGNHLIKNIKALVWASAYFDGAEAGWWHRLALGLLSRELDAQILVDGPHYERSPSYHCQVFVDLLECRHALGGDPFGSHLDAALAHMAQAIADFSHPDGFIAQFNDAGLTMAYAPATCLDAYEAAGGRRPAPRQRFAYPDAGYFGLRAGDVYFMADCGRIAPDDLPAHGHGDALSFEWSVAGKRVIVDQGVFEYVAGEKRRLSRSASSHNTLCLEGADQADFFGAFRCGRRPKVETRRYEEHSDGFLLEGAHDGFTNLPGRPRHVRRFVVSSDRITIDDRLEGSMARRARIGFLLHPDVTVAVDGITARLTRGAAEIVVEATAQIRDEPAVWWPDMGREAATRRLTLTLPVGVSEATTTFRIVTAARPA
jgi:uncharacterized heparinase superfamily protein